MRKTTNYSLTLYDKEDKMSITAEQDSLNANMHIIDSALKDKATINDMTTYINEHKNELKGPQGIQGIQGIQGEKGDKGDTGAAGPKGDKGEGFSIAKTYSSVAEMNADYSNPNIALNAFVIINTGNVDDADNAKLYVKTETGYSYLTDLSGAQGIKGDKGDKGADGTNGANGKDGVSCTHSWNGTTLTINSASGTSSADLKGDKGDKGDKGEQGIQGIQGVQGIQGEKGTDGKTPVKGTDYWTEEDKEAIITDLINTDEFKSKADTFTEWESINADVVTNTIFFHGWQTVFKYQNNGAYIKTDVSKYTKLKLTTYEWGSLDYPFYAFLDSAGNIVSFESGESAKIYTDHEVVVPNGAVTIILNGRVGNTIGIKGLKLYDIKTLNLEKANRITKWVTVPFNLVGGKLIKYNGTEYTHASGGYTEVDVSNYLKVNVVGQQWQLNNFYVCYFYDATGNIISKYGGETQNTKVELTVDVPDGAVKMIVNGQSSATSIEIEAYEMFDMGNLVELLKPTGLKLMTLGDSITAMGLQSDGWVKYFIEKTECELVANVAVHGARLHDFEDTVYDGNPVINGADNNHNNVLGNQIQKIINNAYEAPDIIMIAIGTNAGIYITLEDMTEVYYGTGTTLLPLENVDRTTSAGAYRYCLEKLHSLYPNAIIFWCTPIMGYQATRSAENAMKYAESLRIATEYTGQMLIDTIRCGINGVNEVQSANGEYLKDGLHPNANGAKKIGYFNASRVKEFLGNNFKEI